MHEITLASGWDTSLLALGFIAALGFGIFRLDVILFRPHHTTTQPRQSGGTDADGEPILRDPDGRPWTSQSGPE
jgi:hypothetical protein